MIISHENKFIFIKTKKTAGTSLEIALSKYCSSIDTVTPISASDEATRTQLGYVGPTNHKKPLVQYTAKELAILGVKFRPALAFYNHISATEIEALVAPRVWQEYSKISIVRNPYDHAVSMYYWAQKHTKSKQTFKDYLMYNPSILVENRRITNINGQSAVDFMVRYENFENDLTELSQHLKLGENLWNEFKNLSSKGGIRPTKARTQTMFADFEEGVELIKILCADDIKKFNYLPPEN